MKLTTLSSLAVAISLAASSAYASPDKLCVLRAETVLRAAEYRDLGGLQENLNEIARKIAADQPALDQQLSLSINQWIYESPKLSPAVLKAIWLYGCNTSPLAQH